MPTMPTLIIPSFLLDPAMAALLKRSTETDLSPFSAKRYRPTPPPPRRKLIFDPELSATVPPVQTLLRVPAVQQRDRDRPCIEPGCTVRHALFNYPGETRRLYCSQHAKPGMCDIKSLRCAVKDCGRICNFNWPGAKRGRFCSAHAQEGMKDVVATFCQAPNCPRYPSFLWPGTSTRLRCALHKEAGMVCGHSSEICQTENCQRIASFNVFGETKGRFCAEHKQAGMLNVTSKYFCEATACSTIPYFNFPGQTRGLRCAEHKLEGMVNVRDAHCQQADCPRLAYFNLPGERRGRFCSEHRHPEHINVKIKVCSVCGSTPSFYYRTNGKSGERFCEHHRTADMHRARTRGLHVRCVCQRADGVRCCRLATHNVADVTVPMYCETHKTALMVPKIEGFTPQAKILQLKEDVMGKRKATDDETLSADRLK